jgi:hypothetical protein
VERVYTVRPQFAPIRSLSDCFQGTNDGSIKEQTGSESMKSVVINSIVSALILASCASTPHDPAVVKQLLGNAPRISSSEGDIESFVVEGTIKTPVMAVRFVVAGESSGNVSMSIYDMNDQTPIMVGRKDSCLIFDPVTPRVAIGRSKPFFALGTLLSADGEQDLNIEVGVDPTGEKPTYVDIGSILALASEEYEITSEDGQNFTSVSMTQEGNRLVTYVSPGRQEGEITRLELFHNDSNEPFLLLSRIDINVPLPEGCFVFPENALRESTIPVTGLPIDNLMELAKLSFFCFVGHSVMDGNADAAEIEGVFPGEMDLARMQGAEKAYSPLLKSIFKMH